MKRDSLALFSLVMLSGTSENVIIQALWSGIWLLVFWYSITCKNA